MTQEPIRIGVLGAARIAPFALTRPAPQVPGIEVAAVAARDPRRAAKFARKHGIGRVHDSYEALIADPELDAIYNPLPNGLHGRWTVPALQAGKHVLCEKPLTANADEARQVADVAEGSGLVLMEAFHWRYHPLAQMMIDVVSSGEIGDLEHIDMVMSAPVIPPGDIRWNLALAGGSFMDMGCYTVSIVRAIAGQEPTVDRATAQERSPGIDRRMQADLSFPSGATATVTAAMLGAPYLRIALKARGSHGQMSVFNPVVPQLYSRATISGRNGRRRLRPPRTATYRHQLEAFVAAVRDGADVITDPAYSVANMTVVDAVYEASGLGRREPSTG